MEEETVEKPEYVGLWDRIMANMIDQAALLVVSLIVTPLLPIVPLDPNAILVQLPEGATFSQMIGVMMQQEAFRRLLMLNLLQILAVCAATVWFWKRYGATPGKMVMRMKIVDAKTFGAPTTGQDIARFLGYFLSAFPGMVGFLWIAFDKRKQGFHDKIAGTVVIKLKKKAVVS